MTFARGAALGLALVAGFTASQRLAAQQAADGAAIYRQSCASCHDNPTGRTPSREALHDRTADAVLAALTNGSMAFQAQSLSAAERRAVAAFVAGTPFGGAVGSNANTCPAPSSSTTSTPAPGWNGWGVDRSNSRFQPGPGLTAEDVPKLRLRWAFGFPNGAQAYGNPVIVSGRVYVGSDGGVFYSLDAETGCTYWTFRAEAGIRAAPTVGPLDSNRGGSVQSRRVVYVADLKANVYALETSSGDLVWKVKVDNHRLARVTGAPALYDGRLFVPVSSAEEVPAAQPTYECCTFRGNVVALNARDGTQIWKSYTVAETPQQVGRNSSGTPQWAPAGAAVWASPTIDPVRHALYIGTGNSYTEPAVKTSDSVMAMDLGTGKIVWFNQVTSADAFVVGCRPGVENCPKDLGPDHDFGNPPILRTLPTGKRIIVIGQKSGEMWGLDPDNQGKVVWQFKAGKGSALGGIEWGTAADATNVYVPVSDVLSAPAESGGMYALNLANGHEVWHAPAPKLECTGGRGCTGAQSAPASVMPGVVFSGSVDGHIRAYSTGDGHILWDFDTAREFETVNGVKAKGGSIDAAGPAIAEGLVVTNSGYALWRGIAGNVLLAFSK